MGREVWTVLLFVGVIMIWNRYGGTGEIGEIGRVDGATLRIAQGKTPWVARLVGACLLAFLALRYRRDDGSWMRHAWWGILGLIG